MLASTSTAKEVPVFYPTHKEFQDFNKYVAKIERSGAAQIGLAKVVPPEGWTACERGYEDLNIELTNPLLQQVTGSDGKFVQYATEKPSISAAEYMKLSNTIKYCTPVHDSYDELESMYWKNLKYDPPLYGADVPASLFDDKQKNWNLGNLGTILDLMSDKYKHRMLGVTSPYLYFGMWKTTFPWHTEDMDLYAINYLHHGAPKTWYCVPSDHGRRLERLAAGFYPRESSSCSAFMRHKTIIMSPKVLKNYSIPVYKVIHNPGEFMITFPFSYHMGYNHGYNIAEAINFATERWIDFGKDSLVCKCAKVDSVAFDMGIYVQKYQPKQYKKWREENPQEIYWDEDDKEEESVKKIPAATAGGDDKAKSMSGRRRQSSTSRSASSSSKVTAMSDTRGKGRPRKARGSIDDTSSETSTKSAEGRGEGSSHEGVVRRRRGRSTSTVDPDNLQVADKQKEEKKNTSDVKDEFKEEKTETGNDGGDDAKKTACSSDEGFSSSGDDNEDDEDNKLRRGRKKKRKRRRNPKLLKDDKELEPVSDESFCSKELQAIKLGLDLLPIVTTPYWCGYCGDVFSTNEMLTNHLDIHTAMEPFRCELCGKRFAEKAECESHVVSYMIPAPLKCTINTSNVFVCRPAINANGEAYPTSRVVDCRVCGLPFSDRFLLRRHLLDHQKGTVDLPNIKQERVLRAPSISSQSEKDSDTGSTVSVNSRSFKCKECSGMEFFTQAMYRSHKRAHEGKELFKCDCGLTFSKGSDFLRHVSTIHGAVRTNIAKVSNGGKNSENKAITRRQSGSRHDSVSSNPGPPNPVSEKETKTRNPGKNTAKSNGAKRRRKKSVGSLTKAEIEEMYDEWLKEDRTQCEECGKVLYSARSLQRHFWTHTSIRPVSCSVCSKGFSDNSELNRHMKNVHTSIRERKKSNVHHEAASKAKKKAVHAALKKAAQKPLNVGRRQRKSTESSVVDEDARLAQKQQEIDNGLRRSIRTIFMESQAKEKEDNQAEETSQISLAESSSKPTITKTRTQPARTRQVPARQRPVPEVTKKVLKKAKAGAKQKKIPILPKRSAKPTRQLPKRRRSEPEIATSRNVIDDNGEVPRQKLECDVCGVLFNKVAQLNAHMRSHKKDMIVANKQLEEVKQAITGVPSVEGSDVEVDDTLIRAEPEVREKYFCETCNKEFEDRETLQCHRLYDICETLYKCDTCDKAFTRKSAMESHKILHSEELAVPGTKHRISKYLDDDSDEMTDSKTKEKQSKRAPSKKVVTPAKKRGRPKKGAGAIREDLPPTLAKIGPDMKKRRSSGAVGNEKTELQNEARDTVEMLPRSGPLVAGAATKRHRRSSVEAAEASSALFNFGSMLYWNEDSPKDDGEPTAPNANTDDELGDLSIISNTTATKLIASSTESMSDGSTTSHPQGSPSDQDALRKLVSRKRGQRKTSLSELTTKKSPKAQVKRRRAQSGMVEMVPTHTGSMSPPGIMHDVQPPSASKQRKPIQMLLQQPGQKQQVLIGSSPGSLSSLQLQNLAKTVAATAKSTTSSSQPPVIDLTSYPASTQQRQLVSLLTNPAMLVQKQAQATAQPPSLVMVSAAGSTTTAAAVAPPTGSISVPSHVHPGSVVGGLTVQQTPSGIHGGLDAHRQQQILAMKRRILVSGKVPGRPDGKMATSQISEVAAVCEIGGGLTTAAAAPVSINKQPESAASLVGEMIALSDVQPSSGLSDMAAERSQAGPSGLGSSGLGVDLAALTGVSSELDETLGHSSRGRRKRTESETTVKGLQYDDHGYCKPGAVTVSLENVISLL